MGIAELFILAIGLSMDAFAVSVCKGLETKKITIKQMLLAGVWFGGFQALMPAIGYLLGQAFAGAIKKYDHWVAFFLLVLIGANMLKEAFSKEDAEEDNADKNNGGKDSEKDCFGVKTMLVMAVATSIDALAVGVTFAFLKVNIFAAVSFIGVITFVFSFIGVKIGNIFGAKYEKKAQMAGGIILILIGLKILLEHLGVINF
ncbi:MAG: manganese efflux pump MntP family protein [Clostridium sp.]|nr:manganese efflux pump MntP family protein [Clostridium sp.]MCM1171076.1 manganese efflux pump MntP family protein [Clostridium sp.]MCM1207857.1 manganese efflux pump MntP family protein [Ruminococcus sp.]